MISLDRSREESASADGMVGSAYDTEILLTDVEQPKHLLTYDLGLAETDAAWHSRLMTFANMRVIKKYAHQVTESRITAPRKVARKECRVDAEQTGPQGSRERETRQFSTSASRYIPKYGCSTSEQRKIREPKSRPRSLLSKTTTYTSATTTSISIT